MPDFNLTDEAFDRQYDEAVAHEVQAAKDEPRAVSVQMQGERLTIQLSNGIGVMLPFGYVPGLPEGASLEALSDVVVSPSGEGIIWPTLGASVSVPWLILEVVGPHHVRKLVMTEAARKAARTVTEKRREAARKNGSRGGRPRKA